MKIILIATAILLSITSSYASEKVNQRTGINYIESLSSKNTNDLNFSPYILQSHKFYKIETLVVEDLSLPFEAEIAYIAFEDGRSYIMFCVGDGEGNVESVDFYEVIKYHKADDTGFSIYTLKDDNNRTATMSFAYIQELEKVLVVRKRIINGGEQNLAYLMTPEAYDTIVLKRPQ